MSPYITFRDQNKQGDLVLYILQRDFPHYVASLVYIPIADSPCCIPISGHNLWVNFEGTLRGRFIPSHNDVPREIQAVFESMALWFYSERVMADSKRYKRFKIPQ